MVGRRCKRRRNMNQLHKQRKMVLLPDEIIVNEILPRLPVKALLRFKVVCKQWNTTISSESFAKLQLYNKNPHDQNLLLINLNFATSDSVLYKLNHLETTENLTTNKYSSVKYVTHFFDMIRLLGTCHGLVVFYCFRFDSIYIWNPATRQRHPIPFDVTQFHNLDYRDGLFGFGYVSATHEYKLIMGNLKGDWYVYCTTNNGSNESKCGWRRCLHYYHPTPHEESVVLSKQVGVLVGEKLHWKGAYFVVCFDLASEKYSHIPIPRTTWGEWVVSQPRSWSDSPWIQNKIRDRFDNSMLCKFGGCLSLCVIDEYVGTFNLWKFMDSPTSPNAPNWSKVVTMWCDSGKYLSSRSGGNLLLNPYANTIQVADTGKFLVFTKDKTLLLCDPRRNILNCYKLLALKKDGRITMVMDYVESLISPLHLL